MTKKEFLKKLSKQISSMPKQTVKEQLDFYSEMIDDRMEEGLSEEAAIEKIGSIEIVAAQIISENADTEVKGTAVKARRPLSAKEITILALGAPLWVPLALAFFSVILAFYAVIWSLLLVLWAVELPFYILSVISKGLFFLCKITSKYTLLFTKSSISNIKDFLFKR